MIVYRFASEPYKDDISGNGAAIFGGRWNSKGNPVVYTSNHISLSVLELLVHNTNLSSFKNPWLIFISIPDNVTPMDIYSAELANGWNTNAGYTRKMGDQFLTERHSVALRVPSSIILQESNVLINPLHRDFKKITIVNSVLFDLDKRLLSL